MLSVLYPRKGETMRPVRILLLTIATLFVLTLAAFAIVSEPQIVAPADDDIIIKGGSLDVECGKNHKIDNAGCLGLDDGVTGKFKHKQPGKHITRIVVKNTNGVAVYDSTLPPAVPLGARPSVHITYK